MLISFLFSFPFFLVFLFPFFLSVFLVHADKSGEPGVSMGVRIPACYKKQPPRTTTGISVPIYCRYATSINRSKVGPTRCMFSYART